jgi:CRP-like cAMP-binding protein/CheY-like chemotaxis protein/HD-like signal output (HDOD) protein
MANILLVDPDDNAFLALKGVLARYDHRSASVSSAQEAIVFLRENVLVDLIFVELKLQDSTGLGFLRTLRSDYFFRNVPVVFYAAKTTHAEIQEAYDCGVQSFHRKPYIQECIDDEVARVYKKEWYWSFFEQDEAFCQRTGLSLDQRGTFLDELVVMIKATEQIFTLMAGKTEGAEAEKEAFILEVSKIRRKALEAAVPGFDEYLKLLALGVKESRWDEFKDAAAILGYYALLCSYLSDIYKLDQKTRQATALLDRLAKNDLLRSLPPHEIHAIIPHLRDYEIEEGATLFKQGDAGDAMYLIDRGLLGVYIAIEEDLGPKKIGEIGDGKIVGEMALIKNAPRSTTIIAQAHTRMMRLEKEDFQRIIPQSPQIKQAVKALAEQRSMDSIKKRAGEIDISEWSKTASEGVRKVGERIPKGFLRKDEKDSEDAHREAASIEHWNKMIDSKTFPVICEAKLRREITALQSCPVVGSAAAAFTLATGGMVTSLHPLMDLAEHDPGLAFQMLQNANAVRQAKKKDFSSFIEDTRMCVNFLGEKRLGAVAKALPRCCESFMYLNENANWACHLKFLLATANIAQFTCQEMEFLNIEDSAFMGALLHDIGKLLFLRMQPAGYIPVYTYAQENDVSIAESEILHMGISSRQMAIEFIDNKSIPANLKNVIRWVEQPEQATEDVELVSVVAIARYMCRLCKVGFSGEVIHHEMLPLDHTQLWNAIKDRVFPSFNVGHFETLVHRRLREL